MCDGKNVWSLTREPGSIQIRQISGSVELVIKSTYARSSFIIRSKEKCPGAERGKAGWLQRSTLLLLSLHLFGVIANAKMYYILKVSSYTVTTPPPHQSMTATVTCK